jgi:YebC/PmpR family DNA-binding regulatory protein
MEDMTYEGYGPGGAAILIEAVTNNRNRTAGDIRSYFNKFNGNLGADGCVAWMFVAKGLITVSGTENEDLVMAAAIDAGALDVQTDIESGDYTLTTEPDELNAICQALVAAGVGVGSAEITRMTENTTELTDAEHIKAFTRLMDAIEDHDDVQAVYTNASVADDLLDGLA